MTDKADGRPTTRAGDQNAAGLPSVGRQIAKGAAWTVFMRMTIRFIGLISMTILARLLVPADFGLVAMATMVWAALEAMGEFSFNVVLIQDQSAGRREYDTVWTMTAIRGMVLALVMLVLAEPTAAFFSEPRLEAIFRVLALVPVIQGFANVGVINFQKHLRFDKDFIFMVSVKISGFLTTVPLAFILRSYWALIAGIVAGEFVRLVLSYFLHPHRPRPTLARWRKIFDFSKWLVASNIIGFVRNRLDSFTVGKLLGAQALGVYSIAYEIASMVTTELVMPIRRALLPGYSKLAHDPDLIRKGFLDGLALIVLIALPAAVGIGVVADPLVRLLLGNKWLDAIPIIEILMVFGIFSTMAANAGPVFLSLGRPAISMTLDLITLIVLLPTVVISVMRWGLPGLAWAMTLGAGVLMILSIGTVKRLLAFRLVALTNLLWRPTLAVIAMAAAVIGFRGVQSFGNAVPTLFAQLAGSVILGAVTYIFVILVLWQVSGALNGTAERHLLDAVLPKFRKYILLAMRIKSPT